MNRDEAKKKIAEFLRSQDWKYRTLDNDAYIFKLGFKLKCRFNQTTFIIHVKEHCYLTYAILELKSKTDVRDNVSRFLHLANYGLYRGNFEFDESDGEVRYKMYISFDELQELPSALIEESIIIPCRMLDKYGDGLMKVFNDPEIDVIKAIEKCEA